MTGDARGGGRLLGRHRRAAAWGLAGALVLLPLAAMQVTGEVVWDLADFVLAGTMVVGVGVIYELAARSTSSIAYRAGVAVALAAAFILVWLIAAVGVIGAEDNPANLMYAGVLAVAGLGALVARFRPHGMAPALIATALAQAVVALIAVAAGWGAAASGPLEVLILNGFFVVLWLISAWLFRSASSQAGARPDGEELRWRR